MTVQVTIELTDIGNESTNTPCVHAYEKTLRGEREVGRLTPRNRSQIVSLQHDKADVVLRIEHPQEGESSKL